MLPTLAFRTTKAFHKQHSRSLLSRHTAHFSPREMQEALYSKAKEVERGIGIKSFNEIENEVEAILSVAPNLPQAYFFAIFELFESPRISRCNRKSPSVL